MILYFARHGESEANVAGIFSNRDLPHGLTEKGIQHAGQLAETLARQNVGEIWCSPVLRAVQTAAIIADALGLTIRVTPALGEFDVGRFEGTSSGEAWQEYRSVMSSWLDGDLDRRVGGGESLREAVWRLHRFLESFLAMEETQGVALIGHGGLYRMALPHILPNVSPRFAFSKTPGYGQLIVAEYRDSELHCLSWGGSRLKEAH